MNKKFLLRLILDAIMTTIMILLMEYHVTGLFLHEALGLAIIGTILLHNLLNVKWIVGTYRRIVHSKSNPTTGTELRIRKPKLPLGKLILNLLLLLDILILGISGILISKEIFTFIHISDITIWKQLHTLSSYWMIILIGIHLGFHWKMIMAAARQLCHIKTNNQGRSILLRITAFVLAILGVKASFERGLYQNLLPLDLGNTQSKTEDSISEHVEKRSTGNDKGSGKGHGHGNTNEERTFTETPPSASQSETDYLNSLTCTGCGKHCSLLTPQCSTGESQAKEASAYYQEYLSSEDTVNDTTSSDDSSNDTSTNNKVANSNTVTISFDGNNEDLYSLFIDYVPILSLFIAGSYYTLELRNKSHAKYSNT